MGCVLCFESQKFAEAETVISVEGNLCDAAMRGVDAQVKQLRAAGAEKVFRETASGARTDRVQLRRALDQLTEGDVLMVTRLDRLARSTRDLLNTMATITGKSAGFRSLHDTWADTTIAHGRLMLTVLGGFAEFERELIRARTGEGRARAKANGVRLGRKPTLTHHQQLEAISASTPVRKRRARLPDPTMRAAGRFRGLPHDRRGSGSQPIFTSHAIAGRRNF
jgi:DNA invertase Pin-like site-specific DNA recombinase